MKAIIVEDEHGAAKNLLAVIEEVSPDIEVLTILESVKDTVKWIQSNSKPDLGFFDIQLSDSNAFEIFNRCNVNFPVIFTTAYNEYAINAFKVNCIDYILKPVNSSAVKFALSKYKNLEVFSRNITQETILSILHDIREQNNKKHKAYFLVNFKDKFLPVSANEFAFFYIENGIVCGFSKSNKKYHLEQNLDNIESQLDPLHFFRANRQFIVAKNAILELNVYFNSKLIIKTKPSSPERIIVSKAKSTPLKKWLAQ